MRQPDEVYTEIKAQLERARTAGFEPTHLDSHMGTLFATPEFMERYIKLGVENKIPVMIPGGHNTVLIADSKIHSRYTAKVATGRPTVVVIRPART